MSDEAISRSGWFSHHLLDGDRRGGGLCLHHSAHHAGGTGRGGHAIAAGLMGGGSMLWHGVTTLYLSWAHKMPIITAWSTPGAALIATSASGNQLRECAGGLCGGGPAHVPHGTDQAFGAGHCTDTGTHRSGHAGRRVTEIYARGSGGGTFHAVVCVAADHRVFRLALERSTVCGSRCGGAGRCHGGICGIIQRGVLRDRIYTARMDHAAV